MNIPKTVKSFKYAFRGIREGLKGNNIKAHVLVACVAILLGLVFKITPAEWATLAIVIAMVIAAELLNTAIEEACNVMRDHLGASYESTGLARDIAAGAVLVTAVAAGVVGFIIFFPRLISFINMPA